ncbi:rRNA methyltransferase [Sporosarcina ureilytica]|uniref:rRNA methyltransferase n=2 Tax=Sporosarcina ureilytica TaxID=298596 RepID=A0A1D8JGA5_9BACL|nr:rRNA methyltransferase [Sporosarcina ureilytica]
MWKMIDGKLIQTVDVSRIKFRTNISKSILKELTVIAKENRTHVNYLLENGIINVLIKGSISYNKDLRPKDRVQYKTTYDKELLESLRWFAKEKNLFINDVIEYGVQFININDVKNKNYRYRIEQKE